MLLTTSTCQTDPSQLVTRNEALEAATKAKRVLAKRNIDLCGAPCTTYCNGGTGGPNPNGKPIEIILPTITSLLSSKKEGQEKKRRTKPPLMNVFPFPKDCTTLANVLDSWGGGFTIDSGHTIYWSTSSCQAYMINTNSQGEYYCYDIHDRMFEFPSLLPLCILTTLVGGVIEYLAWNCQASSPGGPYSGGSCHFYDNTGIGTFYSPPRGRYC